MLEVGTLKLGPAVTFNRPEFLFLQKFNFKKKIIQKVFFWTTKKIHFPLIATYSFWYSNFSTTKKFSPKEILKFSLIWLIESKLNLKNFVWNDYEAFDSSGNSATYSFSYNFNSKKLWGGDWWFCSDLVGVGDWN